MLNQRDPWGQVDRKLYGGKSTTMCADWLKSFAAFRRGVGYRPAGTVIDRRDRRTGWTKDNTVWRPAKEFIEANEAEGESSCETYLRNARAAA